MNVITDLRQDGKPEPGPYKLRLVRGGPFVAAAIQHRMGFWQASINGQPSGLPHPDPAAAEGVNQVWQYGTRIDADEYEALLRNPPATPHKPIDFGAMAPISFEPAREPANSNDAPRSNAPMIDLEAALEPATLAAWIAHRLADYSNRATALLDANKRFLLTTAAGIASPEIYGKAVDFGKQIKTAIDETDSERVRIKAPVLAAQRAIDGIAKTITDPLLAAKIEVERRQTVYLVEQDRAQRAAAALEAARAEQAAAHLADEATATGDPDVIEQAGTAEAEHHAALAIVHAPTADLTRTRTANGVTSSLRENWVYSVTDITKVPSHLLMINDAAVRAQIKATPKGTTPRIAGLTIVNQPKVGNR